MNPTEGLLAALQRATHRAGQAVEDALHGLDINPAEIHLLAYLGGPGSATVAELHRSFGHRRSTLTTVLDRLETKGWTVRQPHPTDRRSFLIVLTPTGQTVATRVGGAVHEFEAQVARAVRSTDLRGFAAVVDAIDEVTDAVH